MFNCGKVTVNSIRIIRGVRDSRLLGYQLTLGSVQIDLRRKVGARVFLLNVLKHEIIRAHHR